MMAQVFQAAFQSESIREGIAHLACLDRNLRVFGANGHRYKLNEPGTPTSLIEIERAHVVEFPSDYRNFMLEISDGGAGPNYGIKPISDILRGCDPSKPFDVDTI
jgi:hypothetical protein